MVLVVDVNNRIDNTVVLVTVVNARTENKVLLIVVVKQVATSQMCNFPSGNFPSLS